MNVKNAFTGEKIMPLEDAVLALKKAREAYDAADSVCREARRNETSALNELNKAQRAVNAAMESIRSDAPNGSDWHSAKYRSKGNVES